MSTFRPHGSRSASVPSPGQRTLRVVFDDRGREGRGLVVLVDGRLPYLVEPRDDGTVWFTRGVSRDGRLSIVGTDPEPSCSCRGWTHEWDCVHVRIAAELDLIAVDPDDRLDAISFENCRSIEDYEAEIDQADAIDQARAICHDAFVETTNRLARQSTLFETNGDDRGPYTRNRKGDGR